MNWIVLSVVSRLSTALPPLIVIHAQPHPRHRGADHVDSISGKSLAPLI